MKTLQKFGGFAALYMAISHLIGIVIFIVILDYSQHNRPGSKARPEHRKTDGHLLDQPAHVRVLWLCADRPVAGVVRPLEVWRTGAHAGGNRDRDHLGWLAHCQRHGRECRDSLLSSRSTPKTRPRLR